MHCVHIVHVHCVHVHQRVKCCVYRAFHSWDGQCYHTHGSARATLAARGKADTSTSTHGRQAAPGSDHDGLMLYTYALARRSLAVNAWLAQQPG